MIQIDNPEKYYNDVYRSLINSHQNLLFMISKDGCSLCEKLKALFKEVGLFEYVATYNYSDLEEEDEKSGYLFKSHMKVHTKGKYYPFVYINGEYLGGYKEVKAMIENGEMTKILENINIDFKYIEDDKF